MTTRREFFRFFAPVAMLPVVGPSCLLPDRPKVYSAWGIDPFRGQITVRLATGSTYYMQRSSRFAQAEIAKWEQQFGPLQHGWRLKNSPRFGTVPCVDWNRSDWDGVAFIIDKVDKLCDRPNAMMRWNPKRDFAVTLTDEMCYKDAIEVADRIIEDHEKPAKVKALVIGAA